MSDIEWTLTDPDRHQFGRKIGEGVYEFKEFNWFEIYPRNLITKEEIDDVDNYIQMVVNLNNLSDDEVMDGISGFYDSVDEIKKEYGDNWEWIVAECYFEYNN